MSAETFRSLLCLAVGIWIVAVLILLPKPIWTKLAAMLRPLASILNRNRFVASLLSVYNNYLGPYDDLSSRFDNCDIIEDEANSQIQQGKTN